MLAHQEDLLIQACRDGSKEGWREVVGRYERLVFSIAVSCGLNRDDAADVTQITFSALLDSIDRLAPNSNLASWLATVARRQAWRVMAQRRREPLGPEDDVAATFSLNQGTSEDHNRWERMQSIMQALDRLDPRCRSLLIALYFEPDEPSYDEISDQFQMPKGSIGPTRARCLNQLKSVLESMNLDQATWISG